VRVGEILTLVRALRTKPTVRQPHVVVAGARELVPLLAKDLAVGGDPGAVRTGAHPGGAAALIWVGAPDEDALREAWRAKVPIVAVNEGQSVPYVFDTDVVAVPRGRGFPLHAIGLALARVAVDDAIALADRLPVLRDPVAAGIVRGDAIRNAVSAAWYGPDETLGVFTINLAKLVGRLGERSAALAPFAAAVGRRLDERYGRRVPRSRLVRAGLAYGATRGAGEAVRSVRSRS
jgi:hypothetical protein